MIRLEKYYTRSTPVGVTDEATRLASSYSSEEPFSGLLPCYANTVNAFSLRVALFNDVSQCQAFTLRYVTSVCLAFYLPAFRSTATTTFRTAAHSFTSVV